MERQRRIRDVQECIGAGSGGDGVVRKGRAPGPARKLLWWVLSILLVVCSVGTWASTLPGEVRQRRSLQTRPEWQRGDRRLAPTGPSRLTLTHSENQLPPGATFVRVEGYGTPQGQGPPVYQAYRSLSEGASLTFTGLPAAVRFVRVTYFLSLSIPQIARSHPEVVALPGLSQDPMVLSAGTHFEIVPVFSFEDVTASAGVGAVHGAVLPVFPYTLGGAAAGDYDNDGWVDLYVTVGSTGRNRLFRNLGDGTFQDVAALAELAVEGEDGCGPLFADYDGDGWLDLFIGGVQLQRQAVADTPPRLFRNRGDGTFEDVTADSGVQTSRTTITGAFGDYDLDGDLDLFLAHQLSGGRAERLWRNDGAGHFDDVTAETGLLDLESQDWDFTPNFTDINNDGWPDLLIAADAGTSQVLLNQGGTFVDIATDVINDENGMGSAIGDYDHDGDLDWFVTSISDPTRVEANWGVSGNRLYRNLGNGVFEDATDEAGVRHGGWGWGTAFADVNNDGHADLVHVDGFSDIQEFVGQKSRLFLSTGKGTFVDYADFLGFREDGLGQGLITFDYDRDGDLDLFVANVLGSSRLYRNNGGNRLNFLLLKFRGSGLNTHAANARVVLRIGDTVQAREVRVGSQHVSQNPSREMHIGLGQADRVDEIWVGWPNGEMSWFQDVSANQILELVSPD